VHTSSFPYFSLLAAALVQPFGRYRIVVDWFEFWSRSYWRRYLGSVGGWIGWTVQGLCLRVKQSAFTLAQLTAERIRAHQVNGQVEALTGVAGDLVPRRELDATSQVIFAARLIPEKRLPLALEAFALARRDAPELTLQVFGRGPEWGAGQAAIARLDLGEAAVLRDFVDRPVLEDAMARALCLLHPSEREGYGLVVVEAASRGTPSILAAGEDNAATELVEDGINGYVAEPTAEALAAAILQARAAGPDLRRSTAGWFERNAERLSIENSLAKVIASYRGETASGPGTAR
jgi:glycosyltransferase involved in cell wall biosynthesis